MRCTRNPLMHNKLEQAAQRTLAKITDTGETLKPLYLQPDRAVFLAESPGIILKVYAEANKLRHEYETAQKAQAQGVPVPTILLFDDSQPSVLAMKQVIGKPLSSEDTFTAKEAGKYIEQFHTISTSPPFSGGQTQWSEFISWWSNREIGNLEKLNIFAANEIALLKNMFSTMKRTLVDRPIRLLHGDLQAEHILVNPQSQRVVAFLDFADAQPGDPLLDIAVLSLWDAHLADRVLEGYTSKRSRIILEGNGLVELALKGYNTMQQQYVSLLCRQIQDIGYVRFNNRRCDWTRKGQ